MRGRRSLASNHFRTILAVFRGLERCGSRSNSADKLLLKFQRWKELNRLRAVTLSREERLAPAIATSKRSELLQERWHFCPTIKWLYWHKSIRSIK